MEKVLWLIEHVQSGLQTFVPEISHWRMLPSQIDHLKGMESISRSGVSDSLWPPWTVALQATLSMGFSRQEYWSVLPFPSSGDLSDSGIEPGSPALWADSLLSEPPGKPPKNIVGKYNLLKNVNKISLRKWLLSWYLKSIYSKITVHSYVAYLSSF